MLKSSRLWHDSLSVFFFRLASNECVALGARCAHIPNVAWLLYLREVIQYMMRPLNEPSQCVNKFINLTVCSLFFCAHILWIEISITHWNVTRNCLGSFSRQSLTRSQNDWQKWHVKVKWTNDMTYVNLGTFQHTLKPFTSFDFNTEL